MKNFKQLLVWQKGFDITLQVCEVVKQLPVEEKFGLKSQMIRAASSIPANVAEGSSRASNKDYARFLEIALGSSFELETHLMIAWAIKYVDPVKVESLLFIISEEQKMLAGFNKKVKGESN